MINKVILMGRITKDPELRYTNTNKSVCSFTVAVESGYGDSKNTDFINCIAWNKAAELLAKYFTKGMMIIVSGRISTRTWEGKDGKKNYVTEVLANEIQFGETKKAREANGGYSSGYSNTPQKPPTQETEEDLCEIIDNDLPF